MATQQQPLLKQEQHDDGYNNGNANGNSNGNDEEVSLEIL